MPSGEQYGWWGRYLLAELLIDVDLTFCGLTNRAFLCRVRLRANALADAQLALPFRVDIEPVNAVVALTGNQMNTCKG